MVEITVSQNIVMQQHGSFDVAMVARIVTVATQ